MRRAFSIVWFTLSAALLVTSSAALSASPAPVQATLPGTNTPPPLVFATSRPIPVIPTDTLIPTETLTPTAPPTLTASPTCTPPPTDTPSPTPTLVGPALYPDGYNPLTGLPYPNEDAMNRR